MLWQSRRVKGCAEPLPEGVVMFTALSLVLFVIVEQRASNPMMPLALFRSRTFALTNVLTLLLYASLAVIFFLVPMNLIQVQGYTATEAGAALLPFPLIMFALSRWSGGLVTHVGSRLPLTVGPAIAAVGVALFAWPAIGGSYWATFFPAVIVLGFGMAVTVAPLTTTVMDAVARQHAGVASGINNAVARVAGLLAVAVFGVLLVRTFDGRARASLDHIALSQSARSAIDRELPKMAGADLDQAASIDPSQRAAARRVIVGGFVRAFRVVLLAAAAVALAAAIVTGALFPRT